MVVLVLTGALGVTSKTLKDWLKKLDVKSNIELLQKAALLGTAKKRDKHSNNKITIIIIKIIILILIVINS